MAASTRELNRDFVAVVRFQGPRANGMPELHKLTPVLGVLQDEGFHVALVTDGRMSGASGKVPAAIHVTPECLAGGPLARVRGGDIILLDGEKGVLQAQVADAQWQARQPQVADLSASLWNGPGAVCGVSCQRDRRRARRNHLNVSEPQGTRAAGAVHQVHDHFVFTPESAA